VENLGLERLKPNLPEEEAEDHLLQQVRVAGVMVEEGLVEEEGLARVLQEGQDLASKL